MSHEVESMFSVRETPWHGLGTIVQEAPTSAEALQLAGLDWEVLSKPIYTESGIEIPNYRANTRSSDGSVLGIVSNRYSIVQNAEAFSFTDDLIGDEVHYETAGSLRNGKTIWLLAKMEQTSILGDDVDPYICFTNSHDGLGSIKVCMTPVRVVCNNTLNLALRNYRRAWSTRHIGDISSKLEEAQRTLQLAHAYMNDLAETADQLANTTLTNSDVERFIDGMFPTPEDATDRMKKNAEELKEQMTICYLAPDIAKFRNTAWGMVNAASDFATHRPMKRVTTNSKENMWASVLAGNVTVDTTFMKMMELVNSKTVA